MNSPSAEGFGASFQPDAGLIREHARRQASPQSTLATDVLACQTADSTPGKESPETTRKDHGLCEPVPGAEAVFLHRHATNFPALVCRLSRRTDLQGKSACLTL